VQSLLPALLLRRPAILKSPSSEPLFAPALITSLVNKLPQLAGCLAAIAWKGGDIALEAPLIEVADRILAYGEAASVADLTERAGDKVFAYGPKTSLAVIASEVEPRDVAAGLARDIALFDQRGCLSIQAVFTDGEPALLAERLAGELEELAKRWPQGSIDPVAASAVQQIRGDAALRGLTATRLPLASGTVVVEPEPRFVPSPGLRTVRIHPLATVAALPEILADWSGSLQGAALAGEAAWRLQTELESLGLTRFAAPGDLQAPDASWHNGGVHPFRALTGRSI
jgi:acyl-CoA reductase-like NAD-dependent aldehyde dehydrogenase